MATEAEPLRFSTRRLLETLQELLDPLSRFAHDINQCTRANGRRGTSWIFWVELLFALELLQGREWGRFQNQHSSLVRDLLSHLDRIVQGNIQIVEKFRAFENPFLCSLENYDSSQRLTHPEQIKSPTPEQANAILGALKALREILGGFDEETPEEGSYAPAPRIRLDVHIRYILSKIANHWSCGNDCCSAHETGLLLSTQRLITGNANTCSFMFLMSRQEQQRSWQETYITVTETTRAMQSHLGLNRDLDETTPQQSKRRVRLNLPKPPHLEGRAINSLCQAIQDVTHGSMALVIDESSIRLASSPRSTDPCTNGKFVTLASGLLNKRHKALQAKVKLCLAAVLSYSLLDFCEEIWFAGNWTRDRIYLFQKGSELLLRPALVTHKDANGGSKISDEVKLLLHGILLLEIWQQYPMDFDLSGNIEHDDEIIELRRSARSFFETVDDWKGTERFKGCVKSCIDGQAIQGPDRFYESLLEICEDIAQDCLAASEHSDPDSILADLKIVGAEGEHDLPTSVVHTDPESAPLPVSEHSDPNLTTQPTLTVQGVQSPLPLSRHQYRTRVVKLDKVTIAKRLKEMMRTFSHKITSTLVSKQPTDVCGNGDSNQKYASLFGVGKLGQSGDQDVETLLDHALSDVGDGAASTPFGERGKSIIDSFFDATADFVIDGELGSKTWFETLDQYVGKLPTRSKRRVRVAVLDTGIKAKNNILETKSGNIKCWPNELQCEDVDGHGTHVAYLISRIAPRAKLYIAKVTHDPENLKIVDIDSVAKAINHFSSPNHKDGRVHAINLSFGFPKYHPVLQPIFDAICNARDRGVLIFAAAGNTGYNSSIPWPASLTGHGYGVIGVGATTANGKDAPCNSGDKDMIHTFGVAVQSCERDAKGDYIHRTGTSFATPIAVAIAAVVIGTMFDLLESENNKPEDLQVLAKCLRTQSGMERILRQLCVDQNRFLKGEISYITPWYFLDKDRLHLPGTIANLLRDLGIPGHDLD